MLSESLISFRCSSMKASIVWMVMLEVNKHFMGVYESLQFHDKITIQLLFRNIWNAWENKSTKWNLVLRNVFSWNLCLKLKTEKIQPTNYLFIPAVYFNFTGGKLIFFSVFSFRHIFYGKTFHKTEFHLVETFCCQIRVQQAFKLPKTIFTIN